MESPPSSVPLGTPVAKYGFRFRWTRQHRAAPQLEPLRMEGDDLMDRLLAETSLRDGEDVLEALGHSSGGAAAALRDEAEAAPPWLEWDRVAEGQRVFRRYFPLVHAILYHRSLVGGFSAPKISQVLSKSGYLVGSPAFVEKRLLETGLHTFSCCLSPRYLKPWATGWAACLRVRALHAKVRRRLLRPANRWDVDEYGLPANQEDTAVTLLAFSYVVLTGLEMLLGRPLPLREQEAYLHLWAYIGHLLGLKEEHNPCLHGVEHARASLESILMHILQPSAASAAIAAHLLKAPIEARRQRGLLGQKGPLRALLRSIGLPGGGEGGAEGGSEGGGGGWLSRAIRRKRAASLERSYVRAAQYTRLLIGDSLGDALHLPFDSGAQRLAALAFFMCLRLYGRAAQLPLIGHLLELSNYLVMRLALLVLGASSHLFPLSYAKKDDGERLRMCPAMRRGGRRRAKS